MPKTSVTRLTFAQAAGYFSATRLSLVMFLLVTYSGCNQVSRERQSKALVSQANILLKRDTQLTQQWVDEFLKVFTVENRAQFPANRDFLRSRAAHITKLLDESSSLNNSAADKYEQAAGLTGNYQHRRGMTSFASAFRKAVAVNELFKSQMQMVSDETVVDGKILNEKFFHSAQLIQQKRLESEHDFKEGKRLLGWSNKDQTNVR